MLLLGLIIMTMFGSYENGFTLESFLESWKRWDANGYMSIAEKGYGGWFEKGMYICLVFLPLYSWLVRLVTILIPHYIVAGLTVSFVCFGIAVVYLDKLVQLDDSKETAKNTIFLWILFPFAFFFGALMTESVFAAICAAFFYYLRKHKWLQVTILGALGCLAKVQGVLFFVAIIVEILYSNQIITLLREKRWHSIWKDVIIMGIKCVPMFTGTFIYLYLNYHVAGNPFIFLEYQRVNWSNYMISIWDTIKYIRANFVSSWNTSTGMAIWVPEYILFFVFLAAFVYGWKKKFRPTYIAWLAGWFIITYSSSWLISGGRYTSVALPLFMLGGKLITEHPRVKMPILIVSCACMIIYYAGYLTGKQVM